MYRALSEDELSYIHNCYRKRSTAKDVAEHLLDILDQAAVKQDRAVIEVFNELESKRNRFPEQPVTPDKFIEAGGRLIDKEEYLNTLNPEERSAQEFIMNITNNRCRVISGYEYMFGDDETPFASHRRDRIKFRNSQSFRDDWMSEKGFPTGLSLDECKAYLYKEAKDKNLVD